MLSICIPIYNLDARNLLNQLAEQAKKLDVPCEIVAIDDGSKPEFKNINSKRESTIHYHELDQNVGRAKIRNLFLNHTKFENLLFIDCDSKIMHEDFLSAYIHFIQNNTYKVVCGGSIYSEQPPGKKHKLRWKYGTLKESRSAKIRNQSPNNSFMTNNFMVKRSVLEAIRFDERLTDYGHEDTLFGFRLFQENIPVHHIDNAVLNNEVDTNSEFALKTEKSIANLISILRFLDYDKDFIRSVKLLDFYFRIKDKPFTFAMLRFGLLLFFPIIRKSFYKGNCANLGMFDFFKIGLLREKLKQV